MQFILLISSPAALLWSPWITRAAPSWGWNKQQNAGKLHFKHHSELLSDCLLCLISTRKLSLKPISFVTVKHPDFNILLPLDQNTDKQKTRLEFETRRSCGEIIFLFFLGSASFFSFSSIAAVHSQLVAHNQWKHGRFIPKAKRNRSFLLDASHFVRSGRGDYRSHVILPQPSTMPPRVRYRWRVGRILAGWYEPQKGQPWSMSYPL